MCECADSRLCVNDHALSSIDTPTDGASWTDARHHAQQLSRALDRPQYMTIEGLGRICAALEIEITYCEEHKTSRRSRLRKKRLRRGDR